MADPRLPYYSGSRHPERYPEYTDSGVEWLGDIPAHWEVRRLGAVGRITKCSGDTKAHDVPEGIPCVRYGDLYTHHDSSITRSRAFVSTEHAAAYSTIRYGDLLFAASGETIDEIGKSSVNLMRGQALCGGDIILLRPAIPVEARFLGYTTNAPYMTHQKSRLGRGMTILHIYGQQLKNATMLLPPFPEQHAIADFLDRETARIDALVAQQRELIKLLQEKRIALISHAVTKGLDPEAAMKDSGVGWLGAIPAHWEAKRTKFAATLRSGHTPSRQKAEYWKGCTIPWFGLADVWQIRDGQVEYVQETAEKISEIGLANSAARLLPEGTVILSRTASVGFSAILGVDMATTQDFVNWVCGPFLRPEYLLYVFRAMGSEFQRLTMGSTHQTIYMHDVSSFSTPVPPVSEQDQMVACVREETARIDTMIAKVNKAIEHLTEYRTALISAAVTGEIDVRHHGDHTVSDNTPPPQARP